MASGFGINGGPGRYVVVQVETKESRCGLCVISPSPSHLAFIPSFFRCFPLWNDFSDCMSKAENPKDCQDYRQDYLECLLHRKEVCCPGVDFT